MITILRRSFSVYAMKEVIIYSFKHTHTHTHTHRYLPLPRPSSSWYLSITRLPSSKLYALLADFAAAGVAGAGDDGAPVFPTVGELGALLSFCGFFFFNKPFFARSARGSFTTGSMPLRAAYTAGHVGTTRLGQRITDCVNQSVGVWLTDKKKTTGWIWIWRNRQRNRQTDRQTDRETDRQRDRQTDRERERREKEKHGRSDNRARHKALCESRPPEQEEWLRPWRFSSPWVPVAPDDIHQSSLSYSPCSAWFALACGDVWSMVSRAEGECVFGTYDRITEVIGRKGKKLR